jgi:EpsI family protein
MTRRLLVLVCTLVTGAAAIRAASVRESVPLRQPLAAMPATIGAWRSAGDVPLDRGTLDVLRADDFVSRTYVRSGAPIDLFVAYYASQRQGDTMHSPMNCLPAAGWQPLSIGRAQIPIGNAPPVNANRYVIQKGLDQRLVYYWFQSHGRTIASEYASKVYLVLDSVRFHRSDAALVRVIAPIASDAAASDRAATDFIGSLHPLLTEFIPR